MKYLKRPVNARTTSTTITAEVIEVITRSGIHGALLRENPESITSVTVAGTSRTLQGNSNPVATGYYKIRTFTSGSTTVNLPILEFHANDAGLAGTVTYAGLGTSVTAEYLDDALAWNQPLTGYTTVELLSAAYAATSNADTRGYAGDMAIVGPDGNGGYSLYTSTGTEWLALSGSSINHAPVASSDILTVLKNVSSYVILSAVDADGNPLSYIVTSQPTHGMLTGSAPLLTYTPTTDYTGADSFTFKANDGIADSNIATISLTVANAVRTITVTQPSNGTITPSGAVAVADGGSQVFTVTPAAGYSITSLTVDGGTVADTDGSYTMSNVTADHTLTAVIADTTAPVVTFSAGTPTGLSIPLTLSATDGVGVTGYMVKETNSAPVAGDSGWSGTEPTSHTASGDSVTALYAWAKDAAGNVSTVASVTGITLTNATLFTDNFTGTDGDPLNSTYWGTQYEWATTGLNAANTKSVISGNMANLHLECASNSDGGIRQLANGVYDFSGTNQYRVTVVFPTFSAGGGGISFAPDFTANVHPTSANGAENPNRIALAWFTIGILCRSSNAGAYTSILSPTGTILSSNTLVLTVGNGRITAVLNGTTHLNNVAVTTSMLGSACKLAIYSASSTVANQTSYDMKFDSIQVEQL